MGSGPSLALTVCPLTGVPFVDPVKAPDGHTYERRALEQWIASCKKSKTGEVMSPLTRLPMDEKDTFERDTDAYNAVKEAFADQMVLGKAPKAASARTLSGQITSVYELNRAFELVDNMRDMLRSVLATWQPPKLVVIGEESSGKSTLLERLLMMSLFPRADGVCTRACIQVRLRHTANSSMPRLSVVHAATGETVRGPYVIAAENGHMNVSEEMNRLLEEEPGEQNGVSSSFIISLEIDGPHMPSIDLVDLPGLVQAPKASAEATRALVDAQISEHKKYSLFLAVMPAGRRPTSSAAMRVIEDFGLQEKTLGVFTHCDELATGKQNTLRRWLERPDEFGYADTHYPLTPYGWVATSNPPPDEKMTRSPSSTSSSFNEVSHGSLLRLQQQAKAENEFFTEQGMQDLLEKNLAGTGGVQHRLNTMFSEYLLRTWAPFTIFRLNRECERLQYSVAVLGSPSADGYLGTTELQLLKAKAVTAATEALRGHVHAIARTLAKEVLLPLRERLLEMIGVEISCPTDQLNEKWYKLQAELQKVIKEAVQKAPGHFKACLQKALEKDPVQPPWPSVEAEEVVKKPPFLLSRFPVFIKLIVSRMEGLLSPWRDKIAKDMIVCIDSLFTVGSTWVRFRTRLHAEPPMIRVRCSHEDVIGAIFAAFVHQSVGSLIEELVKLLPDIAYQVPEWVEPTVVQRGKTQQKAKEIERVRSELLRLLGAARESPTRLSELEKVSLARCGASGSGVSYAWASQKAKICIRARNQAGETINLPDESRFEVNVQSQSIGDQPPEFSMAVELERTGLGEYSGTYSIPQEQLKNANQMTMSVDLHGAFIAGSPFQLIASHEPSWVSVSMVHYASQGNGDLQTAADLAVDDQHIYVADIDQNCIHIYGRKDSESSGKFIGFFGTEEGAFGPEDGVDKSLKTPWGLVVDQNDVYVVQNETSCVKVFSKHDGSYLSTFGEGELRSPKGLAVNGDNAYVADSGNNCIKVFTRQKADCYKFVLSGSIGSAGSGEGQLNNPMSLAVDGDFLFVVDQGNRRVQVFNGKDCRFVRTFGALRSTGGGGGVFFSGTSSDVGLRDPLGIAVGGPFVYVSDAGNHCIQIFDKEDGSFIKAIGSKGVATGEFREPGCIAVHGADVYVSEIANNRVQILRYKEAITSSS